MEKMRDMLECLPHLYNESLLANLTEANATGKSALVNAVQQASVFNRQLFGSLILDVA